jgi:hypothetical protein
MHKLITAALAAAALAFAAPAVASSPSTLAAPPPAASAEAATALAHELLRAINFERLLLASTDGFEKSFADFKARPDWAGMMREACIEEFRVQQPTLERLMGEHMARMFTAEEIRAGAELFAGPAGDEFRAAIDAAAQKKPPPPMSKAAQAAIQKILARPEGRGFFDKLSRFDQITDGVEEDFMAAYLPAVLIRFGQKAQAAEAARKSAAG